MEITSVPSNSPFSQSSGINTDLKSTPGFGNPSNASTASSFFGAPSPAFPTGFTTGTSNAFPSTTSATSSTFGAPSSAFTTGFTTGTSSNAFQLTGFGINSNSFGIKSSTVDEGRLQSISGMPVYESKSHEELRLEDYELKRNSKGDGCDTPVNIFRNPNNNLFGPPIKTTTSSTNLTFVPSSSSPFPQTSPFSIKPNTTTVPSPNPFSLPKTNPNPSQPQPFVPSSTNPNPFPPFPSNGCDSPVNIFRNPNNNMFGPPIKTTTPSTNLIFVPSSSPFPQSTQSLPAFINQNTTTVPSPNPFSLPKTNPNPFQPQPFVPSSANPNPFPPSPSKGCDTVINIFRNPNNNLFGPPINSTTPSTISTFVPSSSPFPQTTQSLPSFINQNTTVPSPNPFSLPKTNPNPFQPQPFVPSSANPNPFHPFPSNGCDTPVNIFRNPNNNLFGPPIKTRTSSKNWTFVPSSSPFPQTTQSLPAFINQNTATVPSPNPFSLPKTNPNPFQPQPFVPSSAYPNPFPPSPSKGCDTVVNIFRNPNNNLFGPPINSTTPSTISTVVPSSSPFSQTIPFDTQPLPALPAIYENPANNNTKTVGYPHINGQQQQYVQANTVGVQSTLVADPFPTRSEIDRSNTGITLVQHGISSLPSQVPNNLSANRSTTSLRIRHVSPRLNSLPPQQRYTTPSSTERKVPFFEDGVDRPGPFLPRENPRAWVTNSLQSHHSSSDGKCWEEKEFPSSSLELNTCIQEEAEHLTAISISHQNDDDDSGIVAKKHEEDVLALMPQLPNGDEYYTEPSLTELAAKEMDEPGSLSRVNDFVIGKCGYGSIKFLGETDVRHLDLATIVQFKNREVIVYADEKTKPVVGEGMNKKAEVTLLNVKCVDKTGKQYVDGPRVESYKEMLKKKGLEQGTEFVSYDPVRGEWRFRVQHF